MAKAIKKLMVETIKSRLDGASDFVVIDSSKMEALDNHGFRMKLRESGIQMMQVKNKLALVALQEQSIDGIEDIFQGPSTIIWGAGDIVELAKVVTDLTKDDETVEIKGGSVDNTLLDSAGVEGWSKAKGRLETIADIAGCLLAPGANIAGALLGPAGTLAGQIKQIGEGEGGDEENA